MTLKRSDRFQLELNTLVRKLRAHTLDSEERERVAEILLNNTTDVDYAIDGGVIPTNSPVRFLPEGEAIIPRGAAI